MLHDLLDWLSATPNVTAQTRSASDGGLTMSAIDVIDVVLSNAAGLGGFVVAFLAWRDNRAASVASKGLKLRAGDESESVSLDNLTKSELTRILRCLEEREETG